MIKTKVIESAYNPSTEVYKYIGTFVTDTSLAAIKSDHPTEIVNVFAKELKSSEAFIGKLTIYEVGKGNPVVKTYNLVKTVAIEAEEV